MNVLIGEYDYLLFIGDIENNINKIKDHIQFLKETGKLLLAFNNGISIRNICVDKEESSFSRREIERFLDDNNFKFRKFYYAFPKIDATNVLYTDDFPISKENLSRNIYLYENNEVVLKNENTIVGEIIKKDQSLVKYLANAFFIECSRNEIQNDKIKFVSYTNMRKSKYRVRTIIKSKYAYKTPINEESKNHIQEIQKNIEYMNSLGINTVDAFENMQIKSELISSKTLDCDIIYLCQVGKKTEALNLIQKFYDFLVEKLYDNSNNGKNVFQEYDIQCENQDTECLHYTKYGLWDLIFQNAFMINNEFVFFDQEWYKENIPIEFILYRAYKYTAKISQYIDLDEFCSLCKINKNVINTFNQLDNILQNEIRSEVIWKIHSSCKSYNQIIESMSQKSEQLNDNISTMSDDFKRLLNEKDARIKFLEENIENDCQIIKEKEIQLANKDNEIMLIQNSKSWKLTKPLRKIEKMLKRGKSNENKR